MIFVRVNGVLLFLCLVKRVLYLGCFFYSYFIFMNMLNLVLRRLVRFEDMCLILIGFGFLG